MLIILKIIEKNCLKDVKISLGEHTSQELLTQYLGLIIEPDHKITDKHKRWIGYTLKILLESVLNRCSNKKEENI